MEHTQNGDFKRLKLGILFQALLSATNFEEELSKMKAMDEDVLHDGSIAPSQMGISFHQRNSGFNEEIVWGICLATQMGFTSKTHEHLEI